MSLYCQNREKNVKTKHCIFSFYYFSQLLQKRKSFWNSRIRRSHSVSRYLDESEAVRRFQLVRRLPYLHGGVQLFSSSLTHLNFVSVLVSYMCELLSEKKIAA